MRTVTGLVLVFLVVTGCGAEAGVSSPPKTLDGKTVATRANALLEKQNPQPGALTCQKVRFKVGALHPR